MSVESSHKFINPDYFNVMKEQHLTKVEEELEKVNELMSPLFVSHVEDAKKEVHMSTVSYLLRRCDELDYISLEDLRFNLNSVLHAHLVIHLKDGSIVYKSDDDLKKDRPGIRINHEFVGDLLKKIETWKSKEL
jgi:hypothetical protein